METSPTFYGVDDPDLEELAEALQVLLNCQKEWSDNNLITVFDELTGQWGSDAHTVASDENQDHFIWI